MGLIAKLFGGVYAAFGGVWLYVVAGVIAASLSGYIVHGLDTAKYEALQLRDAVAATKIAEQTTDAVTAEKNIEIASLEVAKASAEREAAAQPKIVTRIKEVETQIPVFITPAINTRYCIPNAFVGLLNAAIASGNSQNGTATPELPSGESNDTCTASTVSSVADSIITNIILPGQQNAEQLNALELAIVQSVDAYNKETEVHAKELY